MVAAGLCSCLLDGCGQAGAPPQHAGPAVLPAAVRQLQERSSKAAAPAAWQRATGPVCCTCCPASGQLPQDRLQGRHLPPCAAPRPRVLAACRHSARWAPWPRGPPAGAAVPAAPWARRAPCRPGAAGSCCRSLRPHACARAFDQADEAVLPGACTCTRRCTRPSPALEGLRACACAASCPGSPRPAATRPAFRAAHPCPTSPPAWLAQLRPPPCFAVEAQLPGQSASCCPWGS